MSLADQNHRAWMLAALDHAAGKFGLTVTGRPVFGWRGRSVAARARDSSSDRWLRVVTEQLYWASGDFWTGNADSSVITEVRKPYVLDVYEWEDGPQRLRAEAMTFVPGEVCSPTPELTTEIELSAAWWAELRRSMDRIAQVDTARRATSQDHVDRRLRVFFGDQVDPTITRWATAHRDLHWANLTQPELALLDWELWGLAPLGYDAATLYCYTLLTPATAEKVHQTFADILDTPDGMRTQLYVIARLLLRAEGGDHPDLVIPLHRHARTLLSAIPT